MPGWLCSGASAALARLRQRVELGFLLREGLEDLRRNPRGPPQLLAELDQAELLLARRRPGVLREDRRLLRRREHLCWD